jgi:hypothetical protein
MNTIYRIPNTGSITAKLAIAAAQCLNVNPLYLTGEADEVGECTDKNLNTLLKKHKFDKPKGRRNKVMRGNTPDAENGAEKVYTETDEEVAARFEAELTTMLQETKDSYIAKHGFKPSLQLQPDAIAKLSDDDILTLLRTLRIRADVGVPGAQERLAQIQELLLF